VFLLSFQSFLLPHYVLLPLPMAIADNRDSHDDGYEGGEHDAVAVDDDDAFADDKWLRCVSIGSLKQHDVVVVQMQARLMASIDDNPSHKIVSDEQRATRILLLRLQPMVNAVVATYVACMPLADDRNDNFHYAMAILAFHFSHCPLSTHKTIAIDDVQREWWPMMCLLWVCVVVLALAMMSIVVPA
jgi:hypothetical protein